MHRRVETPIRVFALHMRGLLDNSRIRCKFKSEDPRQASTAARIMTNAFAGESVHRPQKCEAQADRGVVSRVAVVFGAIFPSRPIARRPFSGVRDANRFFAAIAPINCARRAQPVHPTFSFRRSLASRCFRSVETGDWRRRARAVHRQQTRRMPISPINSESGIIPVDLRPGTSNAPAAMASGAIDCEEIAPHSRVCERPIAQRPDLILLELPLHLSRDERARIVRNRSGHEHQARRGDSVASGAFVPWVRERDSCRSG